jgi:hypothetical protein
MASALSISRMALAGARAVPARRGALQAAAGGGRGAFGAGVPPARMLGERRLFAYPSNGNGGGRGSHTSTSALPKDRNSIKAAPAAAAKAKQAETPTELTFAPFDEVKKPLEELREAEGHDVSLAREEGFTSNLEEAINQQINVELTIRCDTAHGPCSQLLGRARALARRGVAPGRCCAIASIAAVS